MEDIDKEVLRRMALELTGADFVGIVRPAEVDDEAERIREQWLKAGRHASMDYLERYPDVRHDPRLLLDGAQTMILALFNYANGGMTPPLIAEYALGRDYHLEVKERLTRLGKALGGNFRAVVDTAPLRERYWAARAGLGVIGLNNQLIVPGHGAHFFIGTLLWTGNFSGDDDQALGETECTKCGRCVRACPGKALDGHGGLDARRCLSYLTIESREPIPADIDAGGRLFGCDVCRLVCPMENRSDRTRIEAFAARPDVVALTVEDFAEMTPERFSGLFSGSAVKRARHRLLNQL